MARIKNFAEKSLTRPSIHKEAQGTFSIFEKEGEMYLQIDTYGSNDRQIPDKVSQSIQLDLDTAKQVFLLLKKTFGNELGDSI